MNIKNKSKVNLFLIELIIVILVFAVSSAIIVNLFLSAHKITQQSEDISISLMKIESILEEYKSLNNSMDATKYLSDSGFPKFYNGIWQETKDKAQGFYEIDLVKSDKKFQVGILSKLELTSYYMSGHKEITSLSGAKYFKY